VARRAARVDGNHDAIVTALRAAGASVQSLAAVGQGTPDLLAGFRGANFVLECKDGAKTPGNRPLTDDQKEWIAKWRGSVVVVLSTDEALRAIGALA
jgi:hypothetical protein